jgi:hypothetical protein
VEEDSRSLNLKRPGRPEELALRTGSAGLDEETWDSSADNLADVDSPPIRGSGTGEALSNSVSVFI